MHKTKARELLNVFTQLPDVMRTMCHRSHQMCSATPDGPCLTDVINDAVVNVDATVHADDENLGDC